ncbi:hypothetical protein NDU88_003959 [Pleurodeles waltl]|uniref:Uncharacterized protein n=1 Tax=Pleurodeles waltl TaxID=8319 RepID=A0AAV7VIW6_PLEWA|nr:hypothetical protein NDU88_003959 [Pleurodeles waltl]
MSVLPEASAGARFFSLARTGYRASYLSLAHKQRCTMRQVNKEATPSRYATSDWFYHAPLKQPEQEASSEMSIPPASQIPGLSDLAEPHNELAAQSHRKWIKDTDSDYVKLSKQGGRPDLLKQATPAPRKTLPVAYSVPDWYTHEAMTPPAKQADAAASYLPDYMVHEESKAEESDNKYESRRGPFDFDIKTVWQRDADDNEKENEGEKKHIKLPAINPNGKPEKTTVVPNNVFPPSTTNKREHPGKKVVFPPMHTSQHSDPVNFSKLLSNGYGDDWIQQRNDKDKKAQQKSNNTEKPNDPALS